MRPKFVVLPRRAAVGPVFALGLACLTVAAAGCTKYGPVSRGAYDYATALYAACNQQAATKVDAIAGQIQSAAGEGAITADEAAWLGEIVEQAGQGAWEEAAEACRRMMEEQVGR